jgi:hypothetical protein
MSFTLSEILILLLIMRRSAIGSQPLTKIFLSLSEMAREISEFLGYSYGFPDIPGISGRFQEVPGMSGKCWQVPGHFGKRLGNQICTC